ncbi:MAG TPA: carbamoyltransferase C-terminal domain-containing protein [Dehalococcoidia bacterium]|nr:carbamoyltransferase C-terminal domain-containing protein [Dehalococcoidia bacterium]
MRTLGINAAFHDSSAALVIDGRVVAAAEEERFTRIKHGKRPVPFTTWELPFHAIDYCLAAAGIALADVDHVAYSFDPELLPAARTEAESIALPLEPSAQAAAGDASPWEPLFYASVVNAPRQLAGGAPHHLRARLRDDGRASYRWHFVEHHTAHAASAFLAAPFRRAAILTLDGRGEIATTSYGIGEGAEMDRIGQVNRPHSLGLLYERVTEYLGFLHSSDEYKVMALASYGRPAFLRDFRSLVRLGCDGQYAIGPLCLDERFGPARRRGEAFEQRHFDIAHSLQVVLEETVLEIAQWLHDATGAEDLCMAGGVALNCVMNARVRDDGPYRRVWVQPAAGDAGTALGAALYIDARERGRCRGWRMDDAFLGPAYDDAEIEAALRSAKATFTRPPDIARATAELLAQEKIVGWYQGRMEFGPRALGARSILASPRDARMQDRLNEIKDREDFRPVAPVVLEEEAGAWFRGATESPYMLFVYDVRPERAAEIPAVRHVDGTARVQTIRRDQHERYYDVVQAFGRLTGTPVVINTSFNTRGEPIVCTPQHALACYFTTPLDALALGPFLLEKPCAAA